MDVSLFDAGQTYALYQWRYIHTQKADILAGKLNVLAHSRIYTHTAQNRFMDSWILESE